MVRRLLIVTGLLLISTVLYAQEGRPDLNSAAAEAINALIAPATLVVIWGLKLAWEKIPATLVVFLAPLVGMAINFGTAYFAGHPPTNPIAAASLGAAATWLHQFASTVIAKGVTGPVAITNKLSF